MKNIQVRVLVVLSVILVLSSCTIVNNTPTVTDTGTTPPASIPETDLTTLPESGVSETETTPNTRPITYPEPEGATVQTDKGSVSIRMLEADLRRGGTLKLAIKGTRTNDTDADYVYIGSSTFSELNVKLYYTDESRNRILVQQSKQVVTPDEMCRVYAPGETLINEILVSIPGSDSTPNGYYSLVVSGMGLGNVWFDSIFYLGDNTSEHKLLVPISEEGFPTAEQPVTVPNDFRPHALENTPSPTTPLSFSYRVIEGEVGRGNAIKLEVTVTNVSDTEYRYTDATGLKGRRAYLYHVANDGTRTAMYSYGGGSAIIADEKTFAPGESETTTVVLSIPSDAPSGFYSFRLFLLDQDDPHGVWFDRVFFLENE